MPKIVTTHIYPPIPIRTCDWLAYYEGEEEGGARGYGASEDEAVRDLVENFPPDDGWHDRAVVPRIFPETRL